MLWYEGETTRKICSGREQNAKSEVIKNLGGGKEREKMGYEGLVLGQVAWVLS